MSDLLEEELPNSIDYVAAKETQLKSQLDDALERGDNDLAIERAKALVNFKVRMAMQARLTDLSDAREAEVTNTTFEGARHRAQLWAIGMALGSFAAGFAFVFFLIDGRPAAPAAAIGSATAAIRGMGLGLSEHTHPPDHKIASVYGTLDSGSIRLTLDSSLAWKVFAGSDAYSPPYPGLALPGLKTSVATALAEWAIAGGKAHLVELFRHEGFEPEGPSLVSIADAGQTGATCGRGESYRTSKLKKALCKRPTPEGPIYSEGPRETMFYAASTGGMPIRSAAWTTMYIAPQERW